MSGCESFCYFDFKFQPSVDQRLVRELATGRFLAQAEHVVLFGAPGVGKTHLEIALGRALVEAGHSVLFTSATALLAALAKAETEGQLADRLLFYSKPKLLIIDELGYLPFERHDISHPTERTGRPTIGPYTSLFMTDLLRLTGVLLGQPQVLRRGQLVDLFPIAVPTSVE